MGFQIGYTRSNTKCAAIPMTAPTTADASSAHLYLLSNFTGSIADIVGTVDDVGPGVGDLKHGSKALIQPGLSCGRCAACVAGDDNLCRRYRILGENAQGGYAEAIVIPRVNVAPYPGELPWVEAAAAILPFLTAWQMVVDKGQVGPGTTVLVQGGGSGVGVAAIQIAKLHGAQVITTVGSDAKIAPARALGADEHFAADAFAASAGRPASIRAGSVSRLPAPATVLKKPAAKPETVALRREGPIPPAEPPATSSVVATEVAPPMYQCDTDRASCWLKGAACNSDPSRTRSLRYRSRGTTLGFSHPAALPSSPCRTTLDRTGHPRC